ncbi:MAG TPA: hypothetical protein VFF19_11975 [Reyranella sp.]|nr:hypothetical protein [Reyranella sp.]
MLDQVDDVAAVCWHLPVTVGFAWHGVAQSLARGTSVIGMKELRLRLFVRQGLIHRFPGEFGLKQDRLPGLRSP